MSIRDALNTRLAEVLAGISWPVLWEGVSAPQPSGDIWVEAQLLQGAPAWLFSGQSSWMTGFLVVNVVSMTGIRDVSPIVAGFPQGAVYRAGGQRVTIANRAEERPPFRDGAQWRQPIFIAYEAGV